MPHPRDWQGGQVPHSSPGPGGGGGGTIAKHCGKTFTSLVRSTICFVIPSYQSRLNWTICCLCVKPFVSLLNRSTLHWTICLCLKPFVSRSNHSTLHWTVYVWLKPFVNVCVNSTQTVTQQSSRPFVIKLDHLAHGILMDHNLNKPIIVRQKIVLTSTSEQLNSHLTK